MRRADRTAGKDYLASGVCPLGVTVARKLDAERARSVKRHAMHQCAGDNLQVGPLRSRLQIGARRTRPPASAAGLLAPADAVAGTRWEIVDISTVFEPEFLGRLDDRPARRRTLAHRRGGQEPVQPVRFAHLALPVFGPFEIGQHIVPAPVTIAELRPIIEVFGLTADVYQAVD